MKQGEEKKGEIIHRDKGEEQEAISLSFINSNHQLRSSQNNCNKTSTASICEFVFNCYKQQQTQQQEQQLQREQQQ